MERDEARGQIVEKNLYTRLSSLGTDDVDEMERLRKVLNVIEVKIDDIYNHLLSTRTTDPRKTTVDKLNLVSVTLLTVALAVLLVGVILPDNSMAAASAGISLAGLVLMFISLYHQSSRKAKAVRKNSNES